MIDYWVKYNSKLLTAYQQHITLVGTVLVIAIVIAGGLVVLLQQYPKLLNRSIYAFSILYAVPSMALFALLIPVTGLGTTTAILVLVAYCQYILLRSFATGIAEVDPVLVETAKGMGMTAKQIFWKIQVPLAAKPILAGIKLAATSTIGIATIAATINAGGLGTILFDGLRTLNLVKLAWGTLLTVSLCLLVNILLFVVEKLVVKTEDA